MDGTGTMAGFAADIQFIGNAIAIDVEFTVWIIDRTGDVLPGIQLGKCVAGVMAGGAFLFKRFGNRRVFSLLVASSKNQSAW